MAWALLSRILGPGSRFTGTISLLYDYPYRIICYALKKKRLERQSKEEANIALIESWENIQAMMEADRLLAEKLQTREREELKDEEKGKLFMELMEKRRKYFAALRAKEKRNRPPTKLFDKEINRVNTFVAMRSEAQESNEKKVEGDDKETNDHEEVKVDDTAKLKKHLVIKKDDDIAIDVIPLATKPPVIVDYKLLKEGIMVHYQLIRADGSSKRYSSMIRIL
ncbi:hypothetical protein Tco_0775094 [Tanacetum coccineum]